MLETKNRELTKQLLMQPQQVPITNFGGEDFSFKANKVQTSGFGISQNLGPSTGSVGASTQASVTPPKQKKEGVSLLFETMKMAKDQKEILKAFSKFKVGYLSTRTKPWSRRLITEMKSWSS